MLEEAPEVMVQGLHLHHDWVVWWKHHPGTTGTHWHSFSVRTHWTPWGHWHGFSIWTRHSCTVRTHGHPLPLGPHWHPLAWVPGHRWSGSHRSSVSRWKLAWVHRAVGAHHPHPVHTRRTDGSAIWTNRCSWSDTGVRCRYWRCCSLTGTLFLFHGTWILLVRTLLRF